MPLSFGSRAEKILTALSKKINSHSIAVQTHFSFSCTQRELPLSCGPSDPDLKKPHCSFKKKWTRTQLWFELEKYLSAPNVNPLSVAVQIWNPPQWSFKKKVNTHSIAVRTGQVPTCTQREPPLSCDPDLKSTSLLFQKKYRLRFELGRYVSDTTWTPS